MASAGFSASSGDVDRPPKGTVNLRSLVGRVIIQCDDMVSQK